MEVEEELFFDFEELESEELELFLEEESLVFFSEVEEVPFFVDEERRDESSEDP